MKLQYHAVIPVPSMPIITQGFHITSEQLMRMVLEWIEGNDYQMMRRIQELPCNTDPDMTQAILAAVMRAGGEFLSFMPEVGDWQHIRDIYLITAHTQTAYIGFAICDDEQTTP